MAGQIQIFRYEDSLTTGNAYLIADGSHAVLIDPNQGEFLSKIMKERQLVLDHMILTHEHCDHMAGLERLRREFPAARTVSSAKCSENLADPKKNMSAIMDMYLYFLKKELPEEKYPRLRFAPADITVGDRSEIAWRGHRFSFLMLPGHTEGSMGIFLDENIFFSGDYLLPGFQTQTRFPGGSEAQYEEITKPRLAAVKSGTYIYPGHGAPYRMEGV